MVGSICWVCIKKGMEFEFGKKKKCQTSKLFPLSKILLTLPL